MLKQKDRAHLPEHRQRLSPPTVTLAMFMRQALNEDGSRQKAVNGSTISMPDTLENQAGCGWRKRRSVAVDRSSAGRRPTRTCRAQNEKAQTQVLSVDEAITTSRDTADNRAKKHCNLMQCH